jgi:hypothetical protein
MPVGRRDVALGIREHLAVLGGDYLGEAVPVLLKQAQEAVEDARRMVRALPGNAALAVAAARLVGRRGWRPGSCARRCDGAAADEMSDGHQGAIAGVIQASFWRARALA